MDLTAVYRDKSASVLPRVTLSVTHFAIVSVVLWLLFGGGIAVVDGIVGSSPSFGSLLRRVGLAAAAVFYALRTLLTLFGFYRRRLPWSEAVTIAIWIGIIDILFAWFGGRNEATVGTRELIGGCLVVIGSLINTGSEWQRHAWKRRPGNAGHLLTKGLWSVARHINYFGDVVLFSGWALLTGSLIFLVVPALILLLFAVLNVPAQDRYLAERYGEEYRAYERRTARLIPYLY